MGGLVVNWWQQWFGVPNPTRDWVRDESVALDIALRPLRILNLPLGTPLSAFQALGSSARRRLKFKGDHIYPHLGIQLGFNDEDLLEELVLFFQEEPFHVGAHQTIQTFAGQVFLGEQELEIGSWDLDTWLEKMGEPWWKDEDEDEVILFYEFPEVEWQVAFLKPGLHLGEISLNSSKNGAMASPEVRRSFGVNKKWPPDSWK